MSVMSSMFLARRPAELPGVEIFHGVWAEPSSVRHLHEDFRFGIAVAGNWATRYRGVNLGVGPGQIQLAQPGEISSCEFSPHGSSSFRGFTMSVARVEQMNIDAHGSRRGSPFFHEHLVTDNEAAACFVETHQRLMQPVSALEASSLLQGLVLLLLRRFSRRMPDLPAVTVAPRIVQIMRDYIEDHLADNPTLDDLSAVSGLSPFHLGRVFRRSMGLPPHAYQIHRRIQKAKALLADGLRGDEVAGVLGFADQSHFIRHFKRQIGLTPQVYRDSIKP
jgi:AraC-like DNA-binding protein